MFVENYRQENAESIMAGGDARPIPYPKISAADWRVWSIFLPVKAMDMDREAVCRESSLHHFYGIPYSLTGEIQKSAQYFDKVEVWRKTEINKDPIAVGVIGAERYLIARWGMEKLLPFETIKKAMPLILAWKYATSPLGVTLALGGLGFAAWAMLL
jgi:hypothetical protein